MRYALLLLLPPALLAIGCSSSIAWSGRDPTGFENRSELYAELGPPTSTKTTEQGLVIEEFHTRQKYRESKEEARLGWLAAGTYGLSEVVAFPYEVGIQVKRLLLGQTLRYEFAPDGTVSVFVDGRQAETNRKMGNPNHSDMSLDQLKKRLGTAGHTMLGKPPVANELPIK